MACAMLVEPSGRGGSSPAEGPVRGLSGSDTPLVLARRYLAITSRALRKTCRGSSPVGGACSVVPSNEAGNSSSTRPRAGNFPETDHSG